MTRFGSTAVYDATKSNPPWGRASSSAAAVDAMNGSAACTTFGVMAVTITRRTAVWRGGSSSPRSRSSGGTSTPGAFIPDAFEKVSVSRRTSRASA